MATEQAGVGAAEGYLCESTTPCSITRAAAS